MRLIDADEIDNYIIGHVDTRTCPTIDAILIPEGITNGDVVKLLFPNKHGEQYGRTKVYYNIDNLSFISDMDMNFELAPTIIEADKESEECISIQYILKAYRK